jgi:hypothetical protein
MKSVLLLSSVVFLFVAFPLDALAQEQKASEGTVVAQAPPAEPKSPTQQEPGPGSQPLTPAQAKAPAAPAALKIGSVSLTPYGTIVASAHWNTGGFGANPCNANCESVDATGVMMSTDFPNFANGMQGSFIMSSRLSRFGVNLDLPTEGLPGTTLKGQVETDFGGGFTTTGNSFQWYVPVPRLRLANSTLKFKLGDTASASILAGLAPGLLAPLFGFRPSFHTPIFYFAGNLWSRSPQFRVFGDVGGDLSLTWAAAMLSPLSNIADTLVPQAMPNDFGPGNRARMPDFEARVGVLYKQDKKTVADVGLSGHVGREYYVLTGQDKDVDSWGAALDVNLNFGFVGVRGEAFAGMNLDANNGNFPGAFPVFPANGSWNYAAGGVRFVRAGTSGPPDNVHPIHTRGGWAQLIVTPVPQLQLAGGYGFEDPNDAELGDALTGNTLKQRNAHLYGAVMLSPTKAWFTAFELIQTTTTFEAQLPNGMGPDVSANQFTLSVGASF